MICLGVVLLMLLQVHTLCVCPFYINTGLFDGVKTKLPLILPILRAETVRMWQVLVCDCCSMCGYGRAP